jgi:hypothetical protein
LFAKKKDKKPFVEAVSLSSLVRDNSSLFKQKNYNNIFQFRYATAFDQFCMLVGILGGAAHGTLTPILVIVFGDIINTFTDRTTDLCTLNYTALAIDYCPQGYQLSISNFYISYS